MFCTRCLRSSFLQRSIPLTRRLHVSANPLRNPEPQLSTPVTAAGEQAKAAATPISICPEGTILKGLNFLKNAQDPVALKDEEYPPWLWDCLDVKKKSSDDATDDAGDEFCMPSLSTYLPGLLFMG